MALDFHALQDVDQKEKDIVFGYMKDINQSIEIDYIIPSLVLHSCLLYYYQPEYFAIIATEDNEQSVNISNDKMTVSLIPNQWASCFGNVEIHSMSKRICRWSIRVKGEGGVSNAKLLVVGVSGNGSLSDVFFHQNEENSFACNGVGDQWINGTISNIKNLCAWEHGDLIGIKLDLKQRTMEYFCNGKTQGIIHENISISDAISYRLAVYLDWDGLTVTIENFQWL